MGQPTKLCYSNSCNDKQKIWIPTAEEKSKKENKANKAKEKWNNNQTISARYFQTMANVI